MISRKVVDKTVQVRCAASMGLIREEVWQSTDGEVVKYNLAFINHHVFQGDNGRVLGYDNAHGKHERHFKGSVEVVKFPGYAALVKRFIEEVTELRKE